jgi:hypothetical protein
MNSSRMNPNPPTKPWIVKTMKRNPRSVFHPWFIEVENHYYMPGEEGFLCHWNVNPANDARYDLSRACVTQG